MGVFKQNRSCGISIMRWSIDLEEYVFDHDPQSVLAYDQINKFIHIKKDSRRICIIDENEIGFNSELTIYISSKNNLLKTGSRNLIRMFQPGWIATKQSCYLLLRCEAKVSTTSCSVISMMDNNSIQGAHKNRIIGKDNNYLFLLTKNTIELHNNNLIKCWNDNPNIQLNDNNSIIATHNNNIKAGSNNIIICQDDCTIEVDCDNTIMVGNNCTIICKGDNNHIDCLDGCNITCKQYNSLFVGNNCNIAAELYTAVVPKENCFLIRNDIRQLHSFNEQAFILTENGIELFESDFDYLNRRLHIRFFTRFVIGVYDTDKRRWVSTWEYGAEEPEAYTVFDWLYPRGYPTECQGYESWVTDEMLDETYDSCCPELNTETQETQNYDSSSPCELAILCTGGVGNTGGLDYQSPEPNPTSIITGSICQIGLELAEQQGWYSTFDKYKESLDSTSICILDSSSLCTFESNECPFDATSICELNKYEITRTVVLTGGTGGTGGTGSPNIPDSHLFVPICC